MSSESSPFSVRLHDLKLWQGSYDSLLQKTVENKGKYFECEALDGVSALDSSMSPQRNQNDPKDWDKRQISPSKPFEQLLEEKLAQDIPPEVANQTKRPFLKKGTGLARFRMRPNTEIWKPPKKSVLNKQQSKDKNSTDSRKSQEKIENSKSSKKSESTLSSNHKEVPQATRKGILKKTNFSICQKQNALFNSKKSYEKASKNAKDVYDLNSHSEGDMNKENENLNLIEYLENTRYLSNSNPVDLGMKKYFKPFETYDQHRTELFELGEIEKLTFEDKLDQQLKELEILEGNRTEYNKPKQKEVQEEYRKHSKEYNVNKNHNLGQHQDVDMTPLTVPNFAKPRGTWHDVLNPENKQRAVRTYEGPNFAQNRVQEVDSIEINDEQDTTGGSSTIDNILRQLDNEEFNGLLANKVNFLAMKHFLLSQGRNNMVSNNIPENIPVEVEVPSKSGQANNQNLSLDHSEKELRIFEVLERRAENSSFCSTNTSIVNLMSSTPQKNGFVARNVHNTISEDIPKPYADENLVDTNSNQFVKIQDKIEEITKKTDVLQDFLLNLRKIEKEKHIRRRHSDSVSTRRRRTSESTMTSFSDEERWSTNSLSPTTSFDSSCQSDFSKNPTKVDTAVNTSFDRLDDTIKEGCGECEELRTKLAKTKKELDESNTENMKVKLSLRDLEKKQSRFDRDVKNIEKKHEKALNKLREELENERKKFAKEKMIFETYVKEAQNRPNKKEREEITQLKQDLADAKELIKLKETKNGATQARLRTQIKQLEKEINELQTTVEKLHRENAKLSANQKMNRPRPSEMKMLHEINKNISKLTEETLKKQLNKSSEESEEKIEDKSQEKDRRKTRVRSTVTPKETKTKSANERSRKDSACSDSTTFEISSLDKSLSIEKQYENVFGHFDSPRANTSTTGEKSEKTLDDGTLEIRYSNGNVKTVSPDGNVIKVRYFNGDFKETNIQENIIKYHYAENDSWHTQYGDGTEVIEYSDGQTSKKFKDGKIEISYPDGTFRTIHTDGTEEEKFPDGSQTIKNTNGEQILLLPNGQKEIHTKTHKRREYPDGTVRTLHKDGTVETVYSNGRVRIKDPNGVLIMDTHATKS